MMLFSLAYRWLNELHTLWAVWIGVGGLVFSVIVYRFGFSRLAIQNIERLLGFLEKASPLAFYTVKSYLIMIFMMGLGMFLRSSAIPRGILAFIYTTIGGGLFFSSLHYYPTLLNMARERCRGPVLSE